MKKFAVLLVVLGAACTWGVTAQAPWPTTAVKLLPQFGQPAEFQRPLTAAQRREYRRRADQVLQNLPQLPARELYLEYSRTGNRRNYEKSYKNYLYAIDMLAVAAGISGEKRYAVALEKLVKPLLTYPSWLLPAHDVGQRNLKGELVTIDLVSSRVGWNLALIRQIFAHQFAPETLQMLDRELQRRIVIPFDRMISGQQNRYWLNSKHNWLIVCLCNVAGTVAAVEMPPEQRARLLNAIVKNSANYFESFSPDGYCSEGMSYWNYGFSHYLYLSTLLRRVSGGQVQLMAHPRAQLAALYPEKIRISNVLIPAFADSELNLRLPLPQLAMRDRLLGEDRGYAKNLPIYPRWCDVALFAVIYNLPKPETCRPGQFNALTAFSAFPQAGIFVMRPLPGSASRLALAVKGGSNHEYHNHNDVGSFVLAVDGKVPLLVDPGVEHYSRRTFSAQRYDSKLINSFGHSVPRIGGQLQIPGKGTDARILEVQNFEQSDYIKLDIAPAYRVKTLSKLERSWRFDRAGLGGVELIDAANFTAPTEFESALITFGKWRQIAPDTLLITYCNRTLQVKIDTGKIPFEVSSCEIKEPIRWRENPHRIAIKLTPAVTQATVKLTFTIVPESGKKH